jgi:hypothetical protein
MIELNEFKGQARGVSRVVSTLICHRHVEMAIDCLGSLQRLCVSPIRFQIHDDGTLTDDDCAILTDKLSPACIVSREEADQRMNELLRRHSHASALRLQLPLALKLFDAVMLSPGETFAFCDSDVLFLRPVMNPFVLPDDRSTNAIFMEDRVHSYSLRSWQLAFSPRVRLPSRVNTGMVCLRKAQYDLDLLDWFVGKRRHAAIPTMVEQTAWALLGQRIGCRKFDPQQIRVMRSGESSDELVAGHFTARTRNLLPHFVERARAVSVDDQPVTVGTIDPGRCTALDIALYEGQRIACKLVDCWRWSDRNTGNQGSNSAKSVAGELRKNRR